MSAAPPRVVMVSRVRMNPYVHLLGAALQGAGAACTYEDELTPVQVARWRGQADVLHIHWAELLYRSATRRGAVRKAAGLVAALLQARSAGLAVVYTAHNVSRHDSSSGALDSLVDMVLYRLVDVVHVHDEQARSELLRQHHLRRVEVIAHGNYIGAYPDVCTQAQARQRLGLSENSFAFLALGQVRPYKGLGGLIAAFRQTPGERLVLLVAGNPSDAAYGSALVRQAAGDSRIRLDLRFVPEDEIQYYMHAADVCVLPYRSGTTSGAAILAFSFGKPVVAPDVWPFRPLVASGAGLLYTDQPAGLQQALSAAPEMEIERASALALGMARSLDWGPIARRHLTVYEDIARRSRYGS
jgi:glycosyltransferase involved in cell wall biosynthesis